MGKLIVTDGNGSTQEILLDKERVSIGRHPDNDISLNDKAVSGHHAVIITILQDSFLEDLDSTNGTQVNTKQIAKHPLMDGDVISIGRNTMKYEGTKVAEEDFQRTMVLKPGQFSSAFDSQKIDATKPLIGKLKVANGANAGKELELTKALTTVGRPGVQVAAITRRADGYYIVHVGGAQTKRPLVNGKEIDSQAFKLNHQDMIELAGTQMNFILA
ncbi:FHA domain-containing protein [Stenotrophobium rhamnosiphilum]|uniref:FHA domain-containing protein n=1 Tax=Stenotrophobium rhamnosiphilum TaxID=2029166 RepID=A0A2T5MER4_9GAMM|nr:FHA domain-containing protein [Stenotrophobium rhamnosiphilum]PTU31068.1 hypothetical protein CJD38_12300 [Stenotrophobium rhamnosiphilum]